MPETSEPVTNAERKLVKSLAEAKHRRETGLFTAEGAKCVLDTLGAFEVERVYALRNFAEEHADKLKGLPVKIMSRADAERMSHFSTPSPVIALYRIPHYEFDSQVISGELVLALDAVQDPGNLGTLLRLCDWFGVEHVLAGEGTASPWSPKAVQASMGAIARVKVHEANLAETLASWPQNAPVCGTFLEGEPLYKASFPAKGVIVMGNEGKGISPAVAATCTKKLNIPSWPAGRPTSESLNVAMAAAVTLAEWRRRQS